MYIIYIVHKIYIYIYSCVPSNQIIRFHKVLGGISPGHKIQIISDLLYPMVVELLSTVNFAAPPGHEIPDMARSKEKGMHAKLVCIHF